MTQTARNIGMSNTTFRNASGLPNDEQVTTARDMATLATHLIHDYPEYYGVFQTRYFTYSGRKYRNHNRLLFGYKGTDGIKTGYTRASGFNLTASVHRGNKHLVAVVLGGKTGSQRDAAMRALLDKNFADASETKPTKEQLVAALVPASGTAAPAPARAPQVVEAVTPAQAPVPQAVKPAAAAKPALTPAEAELETYVTPSPANAKKPSFALASVAPEPSTVGTPNDEAQGDTGEPSEPDNASLPWSRSQAKKGPKPKVTGAFHVQVGAYTSEVRGREPARRGAAARLRPARRPSPLHHLLHQGQCRVVPGALRRLLQGRRAERVRRAQEDVGRLRGDARRVAGPLAAYLRPSRTSLASLMRAAR